MNQDFKWVEDNSEYFEVDAIMKEIKEENLLLIMKPLYDKYGFAVI